MCRKIRRHVRHLRRRAGHGLVIEQGGPAHHLQLARKPSEFCRRCGASCSAPCCGRMSSATRRWTVSRHARGSAHIYVASGARYVSTAATHDTTTEDGPGMAVTGGDGDAPRFSPFRHARSRLIPRRARPMREWGEPAT
jgi:hypothetical protein